MGGDPRTEVTDYIRTKQMQPATMLALRELVDDLSHEVESLQGVQGGSGQAADQRPQRHVCGQRSDPPDAEEPRPGLHAPTRMPLWRTTRSKIDKATKFIPDWVKVAVALALGLGTMVGWKRIVVTVGEKIGKEHLTYAQGASAELVAMVTIFAADNFGLPVSTTHVLSSGVAGTMAANKSGLQVSTLRNIAMAWVFTLPAAALLSASLYWIFFTSVSEASFRPFASCFPVTPLRASASSDALFASVPISSSAHARSTPFHPVPYLRY